MTSRERILRAIRHEPADRVAIHDGPWTTTVERWHTEGLPADQTPAEYFGYELVGFGADISLQFPEQVVEETDQYRVVRNSNGAMVMNWKGATSTPEMRSFSITTRQQWDVHKARLAYDQGRIDRAGQLQANQQARDEGKFCCFSAALGYDRVQGMVGSENLLMAMALEPEWVEEMFAATTDLAIRCAEAMIEAGYHFDAAFAYDDNGYRNGTLFSNRMYRDLLFAHHQRFCDFFHARGKPVLLHSCGNVNERVELFIEAGFDVLQPLEVKAGMDLVDLKHRVGDRMAFMGGIDVRAMADPDPTAIEREIRTKLPVAMKGGGYIYHSDHSVPDNVSFDQYRRVIDLVLEVGRF